MPFVAYTRVSTGRQQLSGLGLDAQTEAIERYVASTGETILATFTETESGAVSNRPQLAAALDMCRRQKAILLIARLDRLSRSLAFIAQLLEAGVDVRAADVPEANRLTLQLLAVFGEHERQMIRERTKAALAAAKARGIKLGTHGRVLAAQHQARALAFATEVRPHFEAARAAGAITLAEVAAILNEREVPAPEGGRWHATSVSRVERRLKTSELAPAVI